MVAIKPYEAPPTPIKQINQIVSMKRYYRKICFEEKNINPTKRNINCQMGVIYGNVLLREIQFYNSNKQMHTHTCLLNINLGNLTNI